MLTVGIDEVGRGCWAGPLVAGAVLLPDDYRHNAAWALADSKKMSPAARLRSDHAIREVALAVGLGWVTPQELDDLGLTQTVRLAMQRALKGIELAHDEVIIDGSYNFLPDNGLARAVVKADGLVPAVSAASIIAKVARDRYMVEQAMAYPEYGFDTHVGYGTQRHIAALRAHGPCVLHRRSYKPVQQFMAR